MAQRRRQPANSGLTSKQKQAALVLGICALVLVITIAVVAVIVSKSNKNDPDSGSTSNSGSTGSSTVVPGLDMDQFGDAVLKETDDAGKDYIDQTIFVGDSNTYRYFLNGLLDKGLDQVVAIEGMGIQELTTKKEIYFKGDETGYSIPEALAKMKPRRIIVMMGTNNADGNMSASDFANNYKSSLEAIKSAYSYTDIIVAAVPPIPENHSNYPNMSMETINGFNEALAQMCADSGYKFLNISEVLVGSNGYGESHYFQEGDIHLKKGALTKITDYARTHAYTTEDRRPDTNNIPTRRKTGNANTSSSSSSNTTATDENKTYTAQYNVDKNVGGTLESGDQKGKTSLTFTSQKKSDSITVKAVAADGYEFLKWSDGKTDATRTDKDFSQNVNVTAMFSPKFTISIKQGSSGTTEVGKDNYFSVVLSDKSHEDNVSWTVNGTEIKKGYSMGYTPDKEGTYTIKASVTISGKTYTAEYKLTVKPKATAAPTPTPNPTPTPAPTPTEAPAPTITVSASFSSITLGESVTFTATVSKGATVTWPDGSTGLTYTVTPGAAGTYSITATASANGKTATAGSTVTVNPPVAPSTPIPPPESTAEPTTDSTANP